jgi:hypothetical protein
MLEDCRAFVVMSCISGDSVAGVAGEGADESA